MSEPKIDGILEAAQELFAANGFDATSVQDIADRAGVAAGTVMYHFKTKENLLFMVSRQTFSRLYAVLRREFDAAAGPWPALAAMVRAYFAFVRDNRSSFRVFYRDAPCQRLDVGQFPTADLALLEVRAMDLLAGVLREGSAAGAFASPPGEASFTVLRAMLDGAARLMALDPELADPADEVLAFLEARLRPGRKGREDIDVA